MPGTVKLVPNSQNSRDTGSGGTAWAFSAANALTYQGGAFADHTCAAGGPDSQSLDSGVWIDAQFLVPFDWTNKQMTNMRLVLNGSCDFSDGYLAVIAIDTFFVGPQQIIFQGDTPFWPPGGGLALNAVGPYGPVSAPGIYASWRDYVRDWLLGSKLLLSCIQSPRTGTTAMKLDWAYIEVDWIDVAPPAVAGVGFAMEF